MAPGRRLTTTARALVTLTVPVLLVAVLTTVGPFGTDPVALWGGIGIDGRPGPWPGYGTIDPNAGITSFALGLRAALDLLAGKLPLWNHYEGLGAPLLGEMQSAALFPPTLLLLLPHGQAIEHALLQWIAGLGTYLFLRRFGLGTTAAVAGGLLYEFNGVFAWLRNAVYNPVAFLPWLFYAVESLFCLANRGGRGGSRWPIIGLGALMAALALYAGFPEIVYFYCWPLAGWTIMRALTVPRPQIRSFLGSVLAIGALALLISGPLLIAFVQFLREADVGSHHGTGFRDAFLVPQAFIVALLPYVFGPIFAARQTTIVEIWGGIGGYLGVMPLLLTVGGVLCTWRRPLTWLLAFWVVLAVGASHGVPLLHGALTALPLATLASYCRYLDASWIFACAVLSACCIDRMGASTALSRRRFGIIAALVLLMLLGLGLFFAWPVLAASWSAKQGQRLPAILSLAAAATLLALFLWSLRMRRPALPLVSLAFVEAFVAFLLPFLSYPRVTEIDRPLLDFLQHHAGLQRVAIASGVALAPNFGSVFGIPFINYDDLPVPARTAEFVRSRLNSATGGLIFRPGANPSVPSELADQRARFNRSIPAYAAAGVRYVLANDHFAEPAYELTGDAVPVPIRAGQQAIVDSTGPASAAIVREITVTVGTYGGLADGNLHVRLCQASRCAEGAAPLATAIDNRPLPILLDAPFPLAAATPYQIRLTKDGNRHEVALWMERATDGGTHFSGLSAPPGHLPAIGFIEINDPLPVLRTATTTIFEMPDFRPYASAPSCRISAASHDRIEAHCPEPSRLLRLEVFLNGWTAEVNGVPTPIVPVEDTFQGVDLPAGDSLVTFTYDPAGFRPAAITALGALLLCLGLFVRVRR